MLLKIQNRYRVDCKHAVTFFYYALTARINLSDTKRSFTCLDFAKLVPRKSEFVLAFCEQLLYYFRVGRNMVITSGGIVVLATFWDHGFVVVVFVLIFPLLGLWSYRRFLKRAAVEGEPALIREYQQTIFLWLAGLAFATIAVWLGQQRSLDALLTTGKNLFESSLAHGMAGGVAFGILVRPVLALVSGKAASQIAQSIQPMAPFLPKSRRALGWGIAVSIAAGIVEEIAYRGFLLTYFSSLVPIWVAIGVSALIFGFAHLYQGVVGVMATTALGAIFAVIYLSTGSLLLPMLLHTLIDVSAMVTAYLVLRPAGISTQ
jgi:membrane protease YdiL (CAAX protease family)